MKLLLALIIWSHGICFASAAASASAAADTKGAAAVERERNPEIPSDIRKALKDMMIPNKFKIVPRFITRWIFSDSNNINGVYTSGDGQYKESLLMKAIQIYVRNSRVGDDFLRMILNAKPDVRYLGSVPEGTPRDALTAILFAIGPEIPDSMEFIQKIIDLLVEQGAKMQDIETEVRQVETYYTNKLPEISKLEHDYYLMTGQHPEGEIAKLLNGFEYKSKTSKAALKYLRNLQEASILEEELTTHLGIRDLGRLGGEYAAPVKKSSGKSGGSK